MLIDTSPILRRLARGRAKALARQDPRGTQEAQLGSLLARAQNTLFGQEHGFARIKTVAEFQAGVPLRTYEDFWDQYWQESFPVLESTTWPGRMPYFALTSGTTSGTTKYIPCSREMIAGNRGGGTDLLYHHLLNRPHSRVLGGLCCMLGGSTDLKELAPGVWAGDLSGIAVAEMPWWVRLAYFPPPKLALITDWEEKIDRLAHAALGRDLRLLSGVPSWMRIFLERLQSLAGLDSPRVAEIFPNLEILVHGGVNFEPYRSWFEEALAGCRAETREVYPASEGFFALADAGPDQGLRMILDHGIFYELVPVEELGGNRPTRHWLANARIGINYALVVSTCAGLWAYVTGDTVRLLSADPPRLAVTGRTSYMLSAFGEHLIGEEIEEAVAGAAREIGADMDDFAVGAVFPSGPGELGGHIYVIEFGDGPPGETGLERFVQALDAELCRLNQDYESHRCQGFGLLPPQVLAARPGTFAAWMKKRGKLGGQHKVPRVITDRGLFGDLVEFARGFLS